MTVYKENRKKLGELLNIYKLSLIRQDHKLSMETRTAIFSLFYKANEQATIEERRCWSHKGYDCDGTTHHTPCKHNH